MRTKSEQITLDHQELGDKNEAKRRFQLRCPDCGERTESKNRMLLVTLQRTEPCDDCNRMMALSEVGA